MSVLIDKHTKPVRRLLAGKKGTPLFEQGIKG